MNHLKENTAAYNVTKDLKQTTHYVLRVDKILKHIYLENQYFAYDVYMYQMCIWIRVYKVVKDKANLKLLTTVVTFIFQKLSNVQFFDRGPMVK